MQVDLDVGTAIRTLLAVLRSQQQQIESQDRRITHLTQAVELVGSMTMGEESEAIMPPEGCMTPEQSAAIDEQISQLEKLWDAD